MIDKVLKKNCAIYRGVFACDELTDDNTRPSVIVVNTDPARRPGRHWICIYLDRDGHGEYFDSFGLEPKHVFADYMDKNCFAWTFNRKRMQSIVSRFCGHYCIWYCIMKSRNVSLNELTVNMSDDTGLNDYLVHRFVCR